MAVGVFVIQGGGGGVRSVCRMEVQIVWGVDKHMRDIEVSSDRGAVV